MDLIGQLQEEISPNSWDVVGGTGTANYFPATRQLVVYHSGIVHAEIGQFLAKLSRGRSTLGRVWP